MRVNKGSYVEKVVHFLSSRHIDAHSSTPKLKADSKEKAFGYKIGETSPEGE